MGGTYNAVFKGGGAKGLAYAGALGACEVAGIKFSKVAGSSAGAITAALVASDHSAAEIAALAPTALATIEPPASAIRRPRSGSLLRSDRLRDWFDETLRIAVHGRGSHEGTPRVTFAALFEKSEIELNVVAMDLSSRQPIVFSSELTPEASVTDAVLASSAIPVAFPAVRFVIGNEVHRVVDGGTWANYPAFVFLDDDFRAHHGLGRCDGTTIGFILDDGREARDPALNRSIRSAAGPRFETDRGSALTEFGWVGAMLSSPGLRMAVAAAPGVLLAIATLLLVQEGRTGFPILDGVPVGFHNWIIGIVAILLVLITPLWLGSTLLTARLGRSITDEGFVGAIAAMGVGPSVPYWIRTRADSVSHVPVRITVPAELTTLAFGASAEVVNDAMRAGYTATLGALAQVGLHRPEAQLPPPDAESVYVHAAEKISPVPWWRAVTKPIVWFFAWPIWPWSWLLHRFFGVDREATTRGFKSLYAVIGVTFLASMILGIAMGQVFDGVVLVGLLLLIVAGVAPLYLVGLLARRKATAVADPFPVLSGLPAWLLVSTAVISAVFALAVFVPSVTGAPSIANVLRAEPQIGVIAAVSSEPSEVAILVPADLTELDVLLSRFPDVLDDGERRSFAESSASGRRYPTTLESSTLEPVRSCRGQFAPFELSCFVFEDSSTDARVVGSRLDPRIDESGLAFIDGVRWNVSMAFILFGIIACYAGVFGAIAVRCWDVRTWRRSQRSIGAKASATARSSVSVR